jgi:hypothetical protein
MKPVILEELVDAARRGDRAQFDRLFDLWFSAVYRLTLRRVDGDEARAQSLTQRVLVECVRLALTPAGADSSSAGESTKDQPRGVVVR